ncbi:hypothetical protein HN51_066374 [Arachis hypogaea]
MRLRPLQRSRLQLADTGGRSQDAGGLRARTCCKLTALRQDGDGGRRRGMVNGAGRTGPEPGQFTEKDIISFLEREKIARVMPHSPLLQQLPSANPSLHQKKQTLASTNSCRRLLDERLLPPSIALKNFRLHALGPLAGSSTSGARISPFSSVFGCSRLPPPVSARAVRVGCCSLSVVVSPRFCLPVSLKSHLSHWHLVVCLSRRRRQKQLVGLSLASSPSVGWLPTHRRPLVSPCTIASLFSLFRFPFSLYFCMLLNC